MANAILDADLVASAVQDVGAITKLNRWQQISLAFYALIPAITTYEVSEDWRAALAAGLVGLVAHFHGQLQQSPIPVGSKSAEQADAEATVEASAATLSKTQAQVLGGKTF
jgi:hypothetical protein